MNTDEKVIKIKKVLGNRCFFCESSLKGEDKGFFGLVFCEICYNKYELNKELLEKQEMSGFNGYLAKWKESREITRLLEELFANRCFFCLRDYTPNEVERNKSKDLGFLFPLCNASCLQRYKIVEELRRSN